VHILIFTDSDLDGAGSALLLKEVFAGHDVIIVETTEYRILNEFKNRWSTLDHFDKIFVCDLSLNEEQAIAINRENVVVVDHHETHARFADKYTKAKSIVTPYSSNTKLVFDKFRSKIKVTPAKEALVELIDQYDSWSFDFPRELEPARLNAIFNVYNRPKVEKFIESFKDGLRDYTPQEKGAIKLHFKRFVEQLENPKFAGMIKDFKVVSTFITAQVNEVANYMLDKYDADIAIMVNLDIKVVSFRKKKGVQLDLGKLAEKLCDGGGSHILAGGKLTDTFATFTKTLSPIL
jgi:oligoribonuclease NrnB/cAMP/cGMP phosphodiesterase (DHH superfamily)